MKIVLSRHDLVLSNHILSELRLHLIGKGKIDAAVVEAAIKTFREIGTIVIPAEIPPTPAAIPMIFPFWAPPSRGRWMHW